MKHSALRALAGLPAFPVLLAVGAVAVGCGGQSGDGDAERRDASAESVPAMDPAADGSEEDPTEDTVAADTAADPFAGFQLAAPAGADADTSRIALLLRNESATPAIVWADAGVGEVLLDSVPAGSAVRVDVVTRARRILLRSAAPDGGELRRTEVDAGMDTVVEVIVGRSADTM